MPVLTPADVADAQEMIAAAAAERRPLEIRAGASKKALGRSERPDDVLDISRLTGVIDYEPSELILTVRAATPMAEIKALLDGHGQMLSFEPPDWRALLGASRASTGTLGGVVACNLAGPRRVRAGAPRDYLLGFGAINGRAEPWKAGGKVVKNVTGYDLCKLQAGAFGTLSLLTELTLKVMPKPETACTLVLTGLDDAVAIQALTTALNTPHEVSAAAHLPASAAAQSSVLRSAGVTGAATAIRLEGPPQSVAFRLEALATLFAALGQGARRNAFNLGALDTEAFWVEVGAVRPPLGSSPCIWRLCPPPADAPALVADIRTRLPGAEVVYDWGGGLVWLALDSETEDAGAGVMRPALKRFGGHATLIAASASVRATTPVFDPLPAPLQTLHARIKSGFDPLQLFNPGRMHQGL
jgi:glycolate oxidase FAD binding subunit